MQVTSSAYSVGGPMHEIRDGRFEPYALVLKSEILRADELEGQAFRVYCLLATYASGGLERKNVFPAQTTLADALGVSVRTVERSMAELRAKGWIRIEKYQPKGARYKRNRYVLGIIDAP